MRTLYWLKYNNYYNRLVKKENTLSDYLTTDRLILTSSGVNFYPNDGIDTEIVYNGNKYELPDYLLVVNGDELESRWFVIEGKSTAGKQFSLTLRRDLLVDEYDNYVNAPCFIEKATLSKNDPLIFNKENMSVNQIKTSETPLKDETGCAWVVGYIPKDSFSDDDATKRTVTGDVILDAAADITVENLADWSYYDKMASFNGNLIEEPIFIGQALCTLNSGVSLYQSWVRFMCQGDNPAFQTNISNKYPPPERNQNGLTVNSLAEIDITQYTTVQNEASKNWAEHYTVNDIYLSNLLGLHVSGITNAYKNLNSKIIHETSSNKYYRIRVNSTLVETSDFVTTSAPELFDMLKSYLKRQLGNSTNITQNPDNQSFQYVAKYYNYSISLDQIYTTAKTVLNKPQDRYHLEDQPYDMFCIPYSDDLSIKKNGVELFKANKSIAVNMATQIGAATGSANIYDVQLLPYCPVRYCIQSDGSFDIMNSKVDYITDTANTNIGIILWATSSSFTLDIPYTITVTDPKIENETDMYRLVSPNYNGQFEFSAAMNNGVESFNVDCSYKPFNPYIHINPNFKNLYGQDFNDSRGLICGGDFSLPQLTNAWADYQLNNKNYQNMFDREISNMKVQNKYQNIEAIVNAVTGTVSGAVAGSMITGNAAGALFGLASGAGGVADVAIQKKLQAEALDYKSDMYGMQLDNIKALPTSLAKTSAFTYNNKIFPIIEYYTCTDTEKQALKNKLKYNGMTVNVIGTISQYLHGGDYEYIKGRLIRIEGIVNDFNYLVALSDEIYKGAFFK